MPSRCDRDRADGPLAAASSSNHGRTWRARSTNSATASSSASGGTRHTTSPGTPSGSRLVTRTVRSGADRRSSSASARPRRASARRCRGTAARDARRGARSMPVAAGPAAVGQRAARLAIAASATVPRVLQGGELDPPRAIGEAVEATRRRPGCQSGLAGTARSGEGHQPSPSEELVHRRQLGSAPDEGRQLHGQVVRNWIGRDSHRSLSVPVAGGSALLGRQARRNRPPGRCSDARAGRGLEHRPMAHAERTSPMPPTLTTTALGPLIVSQRNPRYFTHRDDPTGRAVYLTGSHIWNNFQDGMGPGADAPSEPERMDFDEYLRFLTERGHNFIRLWRWEQFKSQAAGGNYHLNMTPQPWARTGPGNAKDGKPKFDLDRFDAAFFARLRERVEQAGEAGIYVGVLLFDGWALHLSPPPDHIEGHPFHAGEQRQWDRARHRSTTCRSCRWIRGSRPSRRRSSRRWSTRSTTCRTCFGRSRTSRPATGSSPTSSPIPGDVEGTGVRRLHAWQYWVIDIGQAPRDVRAAMAPTRSGCRCSSRSPMQTKSTSRC